MGALPTPAIDRPSLWELWVRAERAEARAGLSVPELPGVEAPAAPDIASPRLRHPGAAPPAPVLLRLIEEAARACRREGVEPTLAALAARIGARVGMPPALVAQRLARLPRRPPAAVAASGSAVPTMADAAWWRALAPLAEEVLAERERQVFFARCLPPATPAEATPAGAPPQPAAGGLAAHLRARHCMTEASARRKMTIALDRLGHSRGRPDNGAA
ncbi:MAG: hypothetical protein KGL12_00750 [Rhodospirillales bacterium]|nr:hypothetical protein [Rhodospirillales bacterium]